MSKFKALIEIADKHRTGALIVFAAVIIAGLVFGLDLSGLDFGGDE